MKFTTDPGTRRIPLARSGARIKKSVCASPPVQPFSRHFKTDAAVRENNNHYALNLVLVGSKF